MHNIFIKIPEQAESIIEKLQDNGFEAFVVGGCVRDCLLGKQPQDWDITTSASPQEIKSIFNRTIDTGILHGTVTVMKGREAYEVTTYRIDGEYEDCRHPKQVLFTSSLEEDLKRRDFTINAMAYNGNAGLIDLFGGERDLKDRQIRCVGNAKDRFTEDALRILRAIRFSAQLGFSIDSDTRAAIRVLAPNLCHVSKERIQMELTKLLLSEHPDYIEMIFEDEISLYISETFSIINPEKAWLNKNLPSVRHLRWGALLRYQTQETAETILKELKMDHDTIAKVKLLSGWWQKPVGMKETDIRRTMSQMSSESFDDLLTMKRFVACGRNKETTKAVRELFETTEKNSEAREIPESTQDMEIIDGLVRQIRSREDCIHLKTLKVTGKDLIDHGMKPGKAVGEALNLLLDLVLESPWRNNKEELLQELRDRGYFSSS